MKPNDDVLRSVARLVSDHIDRHAERVRTSYRPSLVLPSTIPDAGSRAREVGGARDARAS